MLDPHIIITSIDNWHAWKNLAWSVPGIMHTHTHRIPVSAFRETLEGGQCFPGHPPVRRSSPVSMIHLEEKKVDSTGLEPASLGFAPIHPLLYQLPNWRVWDASCPYEPLSWPNLAKLHAISWHVRQRGQGSFQESWISLVKSTLTSSCYILSIHARTHMILQGIAYPTVLFHSPPAIMRFKWD